jgi:uncharacterized protein YdaU (DUF1376 family)
MARKQPKYVSLEPDAFLSDVDFQTMTAEERGVYFTIILYLYRNGGKLRNDQITISKLCNVNGDFDFQSVLQKFKVKRGWIYHKRVSKELKKAQVLVDRAVKAAESRWLKHSSSNAQASAKQCQGKEREGTISKGIKEFPPKERAREFDSPLDPSEQQAMLEASEKLAKLIEPANDDDWKAFARLMKWAALQDPANRHFAAILDIAKSCKRAKKPGSNGPGTGR